VDDAARTAEPDTGRFGLAVFGVVVSVDATGGVTDPSPRGRRFLDLSRISGRRQIVGCPSWLALIKPQ
jgi:hypothetical protein